jgi:outer membrane protein assembly factor BamB
VAGGLRYVAVVVVVAGLLSRAEVALRDYESRWLAADPDHVLGPPPAVAALPGPRLTPAPTPEPERAPAHRPPPALRYEVLLHPPRTASGRGVASPAWNGTHLYVGGERALVEVAPDGTVTRHASPFAEGGYPLVADDGRVWMLETTGMLATFDDEGRFRSHFGGAGNVAGAAAISHDGGVFVPSEHGEIWAFDLRPAPRSRWRAEGRGTFQGLAVGADDTVYGASMDDVLRAVKPDGGSRWGYELPGGPRSAPAIGEDGRLYVGGTRLRALSAFGELAWERDLQSPVRSQAVLSPDGMVYVGSEDGRVHAVTSDGRPVWSFPTGGPVRSAAAIAADGTVYVGSHDGRLYALHPTGTEKWSLPTEGPVGSPTVLPDESVVFTSADGRLRSVVDLGNGGLARGGWPKWAGNLANTARAARP